MFTSINARISMQGYILLRLYSYKCLHTTMPKYLYTITYLYALIPIHDDILPCSYIYTCFHTFAAIYALYSSTYFYAHIPIRDYIHLRPYTETCLYNSTPIYLNMLTDLYGYITIHVQRFLHRYIYMRFHTTPIYTIYILTFIHIHIRDIHENIHICPYTYTSLHISISIHISIYVYKLLRQ